VDGLWATKSEGVGLIVRPRLPTYVITIHQRHRQTDGQTTCDRNTALCTIMHRAVKTDSRKAKRDTWEQTVNKQTNKTMKINETNTTK